MRTVQDLLKIEKSFIGVKENPPKSNKVLFNTSYYNRAVSGSNYPWCVVFQWYCFQKAGMSDLFFGGNKTASCGTLVTYAKSNKQWITSNYKIGDLVIFDFKPLNGRVDTDHIGFVTDINSDGSVTTIEGNTSVSNDSNGGAVMSRNRPLSYIIGAYRPKYEQGDELQVIIDEIMKKSGNTEEEVIEGIALMLKFLNRTSEDWEKKGVQILKSKGLITSDHDAREPVEYGELGVMLERMK